LAKQEPRTDRPRRSEVVRREQEHGGRRDARIARAERKPAWTSVGAGLSTARLPLATDVRFGMVMAADMPFVSGG
jgi:hypothetical protein